VIGPDGAQLIAVDNPTGIDENMSGPEDVMIAALDAGVYKIRVVPFVRPDAKPGRYSITLAESRNLTARELANAQGEREVAAVEQRWEAAVDKRDVTTMGQIMRDDGFAMAPVASDTRAKVQHLAGFEQARKEAAKAGAAQDHTVSEHVIKVFGDTAVSTGRAVISTSVNGKIASRFSGQFVHVWQKDPTGWKLIVDHFYPYGRPPREKKDDTVTVDPDVLAAYAGTYQIEDGGKLVLRVDNGKLVGTMSNPFGTNDGIAFVPLSATRFALFGGASVATFVRSPRGEVEEIVLTSDAPASRALKVAAK
jgi:ketosteroid isomerase-like protein